MGSNSSSGGGGGNNKTYSSSREIGLMNQYKEPTKRALDTEKAKREAFKEQGAYNTRRSIAETPSLVAKVVGSMFSEPLQKNAKRTREFFTDYVLGSGGKKNSLYAGMNKAQFEQLSVEKQNQIYSEYSKNRMSGTRDAYGREVRQEGGAIGSSGQVVQAPTVTAPTTAEVSQAAPEVTAEQARATANELIAKKRRGIGRSMTILTSAQGIEDDKNLILGKKTLLG